MQAIMSNIVPLMALMIFSRNSSGQQKHLSLTTIIQGVLKV